MAPAPSSALADVGPNVVESKSNSVLEEDQKSKEKQIYDDDLGSQGANSNMEQQQYLSLPKRPIPPTQQEINDEVKAVLGYCTDCLYTDAEGNEEGLRRTMNELAAIAELQKRRKECQEKERMINFRYENELRAYDAKIAENPGWAKLAQRVEAKQKKRALPSSLKKGPGAGPGPSKRPRTITDDEDERVKDASQDGDEDNDSGEAGDSDYAQDAVHVKKRDFTKGYTERDSNYDDGKHKKRDSHGVEEQDQDAEEVDEANLLGGDLYYFKIDKQKMNEEQQQGIRKKQREYDQLVKQLRGQRADFEGVKSITIRRTKIEQWVDEPFFKHTIKDLFVKVGNGKKFLLAQVKDVKEDESNIYVMTNGKKTHISLELMMSEPDKLKLVKINEISNQEATAQDHHKLMAIRHEYRVPQVTKDKVYMKQCDLKHARNYVYKKGEVEQITTRRFERALKTGDLREFPNVKYFYDKYVIGRDLALSKKKEAENITGRIEKLEEEGGNTRDLTKLRDDRRRLLGEDGAGADLFARYDAAIDDLNKKINIIDQYLKEDTRLIKQQLKNKLTSNFVPDPSSKPDTVDNIAHLEHKKEYYEWVEQQNRLTPQEMRRQLLKKHSILAK